MDRSPRPDTAATDPVAELLAPLREVAPDVLTRDRHLTALLAEVRTVDVAGAPAGLGWGKGLGWSRRTRTALGLTGTKLVLAATAAAATTGGGLAATGNLPAPVQQVVADAGARMGLTLPAPSGAATEDELEELDGIELPDLPGTAPAGRGNGTGPDGEGAPAHGRPSPDETPSDRGRGQGRSDDSETARNEDRRGKGTPEQRGNDRDDEPQDERDAEDRADDADDRDADDDRDDAHERDDRDDEDRDDDDRDGEDRDDDRAEKRGKDG
ncbi:MAG: hypothetical protein ACLGIR_03280 [Actinomycetes bacterium]